MKQRDFDIVLYGATGFVGELTANYLAENASPETKWALAGRNPDKLRAIREKITKLNPALAELPLIAADAEDATSLEEMAASTRVLISTVGPYALYGEPLVKACAEQGTDYVDLTGEPAFVDEMYLRYNDLAKSTGAKLVHCCGFDSIPHDLGAYFTVMQLPEDVPITVESRVRASGMISGGTFYSALNGMGHAKQTVDAMRARRKAEPRPEGRSSGAAKLGLRKDKSMNMWVAPLPTIDQFVSERSGAAVDRYGPDYKYGHNYAAKRLATVVAGTAGVASMFMLAQIPPARKGLMKLIPPGTGPSKEKRDKSWFRVEFVGEGGGKTVRTAISGGEPGYDETSKMLAESAMALAFDTVPERAGQLTPVAAMGDALLERLPKAGIKIEVLD